MKFLKISLVAFGLLFIGCGSSDKDLSTEDIKEIYKKIDKEFVPKGLELLNKMEAENADVDFYDYIKELDKLYANKCDLYKPIYDYKIFYFTNKPNNEEELKKALEQGNLRVKKLEEIEKEIYKDYRNEKDREKLLPSKWHKFLSKPVIKYNIVNQYTIFCRKRFEKELLEKVGK